MRSDYGALFDEYLDAMLSGRAESDRMELFNHWVRRDPFVCSQCWDEDVEPPPNVEEDDLVRGFCGPNPA